MDEGHEYFDVIIVGAGIGGVNAAYRLQTQKPDLTYTILERRDDLAGTWSQFNYPGVRSDSDLYTFGFSWRPWQKSTPIADGPSIVSYVRETAKVNGIDRHIKYHQDVQHFQWSTSQQQWSVSVEVGGERKVIYKSRYIVISTGFFNYKTPRPVNIPAMDNFKGKIVHPQFWPKDLDYAGKKIVVVGSGATAVTIIPAIAKDAHVTMLQRSPGYIVSLDSKNPIDGAIRRFLPVAWADWVLRWKYAMFAWTLFNACMYFPNYMRKMIEAGNKALLPETIKTDPHFTPKYGPWDQRMCFCPDGDLFEALRNGSADVVTGSIKTVTEKSIVLESGQELPADIIVTATGLQTQMLGGATIRLDGEKPIDVSSKFVWRCCMIEDVPNALLILGYFNNSWTLGADLAIRTFIANINRAKALGARSFVPELPDEERKSMKTVRFWNLHSTYLTNSEQVYPKAGNKGPWQPRDNYFRDYFAFATGNIVKGLKFIT